MKLNNNKKASYGFNNFKLINITEYYELRLL